MNMWIYVNVCLLCDNLEVGIHSNLILFYVSIQQCMCLGLGGTAATTSYSFNSLCLHEQFIFLLQLLLQVIQLHLELYVLCVYMYTYMFQGGTMS